MVYTKYTLNEDLEAYTPPPEGSPIDNPEYDTTAQKLTYMRDLSAPEHGTAEGFIVLAGGGDGDIKAIAVNGEIILHRFPADN